MLGLEILADKARTLIGVSVLGAGAKIRTHHSLHDKVRAVEAVRPDGSGVLVVRDLDSNAIHLVIEGDHDEPINPVLSPQKLEEGLNWVSNTYDLLLPSNN